MLLLASTTQTFSQNATVTDTVVYTPIYLMKHLMLDLDQCDLDRIELDKTKQELTNSKVALGKQANTIDVYKTQINELRMFNDSLSSQNIQLMLDKQADHKKLTRSRNFWTGMAITAAAAAVFVHLNWKYSYITFED